MPRLIDADALAERLRLQYCKDCNNYNEIKCRACNIDDTIDFIEDAPVVDAVEVVHGEWIKNEPNTEAMREWHKHGIGKAMSEKSIYWTCSRCGRWGTPSLKYCPNCGAKMDGERKVSE